MPDLKRKLLLTLFAVLMVGCDPGDQAEVFVAEEAQSVVEEASQERRANGFEPSPALTGFLQKFDFLSAKGFVPSLRKGSTGIGYTLETMLDIEENNFPGGDFMGMELKAYREDEGETQYPDKMNLFLKEPKWTDGLKSSDRVRKYGYIDPKGRNGLYSTVTIETNSHNIRLEPDSEAQKLWLTFEGERIAFWDYTTLAKRLHEKHTETVFVSAKARETEAGEEFHFRGVTWCREPSVDAFMDLLREGDVMLELRMHLKETGAVRNHGSCFRIHKHRLKDLFRYSDQVRP